MQQGGLVLDLYDDPTILNALYPIPAAVPEHVKEAQALSPEERAQLPDDVYALVLIDSGRSLRKFACIDRGNTEINCELFAKNAHKLPDEAQKVAAENLVRACEMYDAVPSENFVKVALGLLGAANLALLGPSVVKGTKHNIQNNMAGVHAMEGGGLAVPPSLYKGAEVSGTGLMPNQPPGSLKRAVESNKGNALLESVEKSGAMGHQVSGHNGEKSVELELADAITGAQYKQAPQFKMPKALKPHVDVTAKSASKKEIVKSATRYALRDAYPLDSYQQVKEASAYFDTWWKSMPPQDRHEYCVNLVKRANELGIETAELAQRYGSESYAPASEIKLAFDVRRLYMDGPAKEMLDGLWDRRVEVTPEVFCEALYQLDKVAMVDWMWGKDILDPWASTYGIKKAEDEAWVNGNDYVTKGQIEDFGFTGYSTMEGSFGAEFADEYRKDPWGIFNSLPLAQKRRLARMATDNSPTGKQHVP